ncbi:MAG: hypothetical protein ACYC0N_01205 [Carboxydocellales bacterium]
MDVQKGEIKLAGFKWLYLSREGKIYKLPNPKGNAFKPIPELANQEVLEVSIVYVTMDRRPHRLLSIAFNRVRLNGDGQFILTEEERKRNLRNFLNFGLVTAKQLSERDTPLPIPDAPTTPNDIEKRILTDYLKKELPILWQSDPGMLERVIFLRNQTHIKMSNLVKEASRIRRIKEKNK